MWSLMVSYVSLDTQGPKEGRRLLSSFPIAASKSGLQVYDGSPGQVLWIVSGWTELDWIECSFLRLVGGHLLDLTSSWIIL